MPSERRRARNAALVALGLVAVALGAHLLPDSQAASPIAFAPESLLTDAATLASDRFEGRGAGSAGLEEAGEYIAERLRACGVAPAGDERSYFQSFEVSAPSVLRAGSRLVFRRDDADDGRVRQRLASGVL